MNRENKRKQFQNGYYKNHRCDDTFTCKHCGRVVVPIGAGTQHRRSRWCPSGRAPRPSAMLSTQLSVYKFRQCGILKEKLWEDSIHERYALGVY